MNLLALRTQFIKVSGRYDLVTDPVSFSDNGANHFINAGQNILDRTGVIREGETSFAIAMALDGYSVNFGRRVISVKEVWANNAEERVRLEKVSLTDLKEYYSDLLTETESSAPAYYSLANVRLLESAARNSLGSFLNLTVPVSAPPSYVDYRGLIIAPPADESYVIEVTGQFYQAELTTDTQENYWLVNAPELLLKSALQQLYITTGRVNDANTLSTAIMNELVLHDKSAVEEEISDVTVMEG